MVDVLIVQSCPLLSLGLRTVLGRGVDIQLIGETSVATQALALVATKRPEVVLLDGDLPCCDPVELCSRLRQAGAQSIFVLASLVDEERLFHFLMHGVAAYEPTSIGGDALIEKIRRVSRGEYIISGEVLECSAVEHLSQRVSLRRLQAEQSVPEQALSVSMPPKKEEKPPLDLKPVSITDQELLVLKLLIKSCTDKQMREALEIGEKALRTHLARLFKKFAVRSRTALVVGGLRHQILSFDDALQGNEPVLSKPAFAHRSNKSLPSQKAS